MFLLSFNNTGRGKECYCDLLFYLQYLENISDSN